MLSYQHAYHAGCLADVHKHAAQLAVMQELTGIYPQLTYVETHSGRGLYRLDSAEARKTGEAQEGIGKLLREKRLPVDFAYRQALEQVWERYGDTAYPGSPLLARMTLRPRDALHLFELHPAEFSALRRLCTAKHLRCYKEDGYAGLRRLAQAKTPAAAMVMIDPSFEVKGEYRHAAEAVIETLQYWPNAVILLWYPMLKAGHHAALLEALQQATTPFWHQEILFYAPNAVRGMYGSGLVGVNLPAAGLPSLEALPTIFQGLQHAYPARATATKRIPDTNMHQRKLRVSSPASRGGVQGRHGQRPRGKR